MKTKFVLVILLLAALTLAAYPFWKPYAKRSKYFVIATNVAQDSLRRYGLRSGQIGQRAKLTWPESETPGHLKRVHAIYERYLHYSGWTPASVRGKRVLELGPGYTIGVPLMFAADGADHVAAIDKFVEFQDGADFGVLYARQRDTLSESQKAGFDRAITLEPRVVLNKDRATYIGLRDLADCVPQLGPASYDMIVSNAVIEEIYDPEPFFKAQDALLRPGGVMVHRIDLRDYGMFTKHGFHPLEFLTVPDWIYRRMVEGSGQPNRRMIDYYRGLGERMGYQTGIYIARVLGSDAELPEAKTELRAGADYTDRQVELIHQIRPRLIERFAKLPDADLLPSSILFVGRKK